MGRGNGCRWLNLAFSWLLLPSSGCLLTVPAYGGTGRDRLRLPLNSPPSWPSLPSVCHETSLLCDLLATQNGQTIDLSSPLFLAVTNVICWICFNSSYMKGDPALETMQNYHKGILETLEKDNVVDIFPALKVRMKPGPTFRSQQTLAVAPIIFSSYCSAPDPPFS